MGDLENGRSQIKVDGPNRECAECGAERGADGWLWHKRECSEGRLPKDAQERVRAGVEESRRARLDALAKASGYVVG